MKNHKKVLIYNAIILVIISIVAVIMYGSLNAFLENKTIFLLCITAILLVTPFYFLGIKLGEYIVKIKTNQSN